tara:strand:+ start:4168 stop:4416 length:249 start_codon:yes stop_codon:yes gene_type:complete
MNTEQVAQDKVVQRSVEVEKYKVEAIAKRAVASKNKEKNIDNTIIETKRAEAKGLRDKAIMRRDEKKVENAKANNRVIILRE